MPQLSRSEVAYLETIYRLNETHEKPSISALAKRFSVRLPSAIEIVNKLEAKGLVVKRPWKAPELSRRGMALAESIIHQHRVLESYLNRKLGLSSELSCTQASKIDYLLEGDVVEKMCKALNRPNRCLHGNAIRHED
jgi:Mn-dependent DtxR family transcriptional regulator